MHSEQDTVPTPEEPAAAQATDPPVPAPAGLSPAQSAHRLAELFPALFVAPGAPGPFKPIKLRIHADILARAPGVFSKRALGVFFSRYTTTNAYLKALAADGAQRFDLDGQPAGGIAEEHRAAALQELARRHAIATERRFAQRPAAAPQAGPEMRAETQVEMHPPSPPRPQPQRAQREQRPPARPRAPDAARSALRRDAARRPPSPPQARPPQDKPATVLPIDPLQREHALLVRAFESSPLSKANFCALKRISEAELDALLAQSRGEGH